VINDLNADSNKEKNEVRKSIQDLTKTLATWMRSSTKKLRFWGEKKKMLKMKTLINQLKKKSRSIISR
jgi:hypothetical protein